jgi:ferritin-like metal-binding protein YciE
LKLVDDQLKDDVILAGCAKTEHLEIAVYENLIVHANAMGHEDIASLLQENLEQEQHTLGEVLRATIKNAKQTVTA